ncbi:MAG: hypothetical protein IRZ31_09405 [Thermogemmatispora sp.]|uniref:hypothetical protein n=1 Tax=Thermogemmatispora sp. TaxID=1968838 RepID=UPI002625BBC3|nr:hypothetical protein [Thermogemmatispora sp.]MBX5457106.1 hypothetical protein [Thermogemmatispora sp.]
MPWCKFFVPKIATAGIRPDDPELNEHIEYAKCIKGHVLRDASDWILCENLPAPDARCWQEGGETLLSLAGRRRTGSSSPTGPDGRGRSDDAVVRRS